MRVPVLDVSLDVLSEGEVLHALLEAPGDHVAFLGAGVSKEAGVPLAGEIAEEIRRKLVNRLGVHDPDQWANRYLSWADPSARYAAAVQRYGSAADRVAFFRQMLQEIQPSFAHHAVALLMAHRRLFATALTTNFDKLLERAFTEQGFVECQAIRTASEAEFWGQEQNK
jgi:NAD-dependent SIR2 family protein deacetylase